MESNLSITSTVSTAKAGDAMKRDPVKIEIMSGDRCVETVLAKYWRRDASGNPIINVRNISVGPFAESAIITHLLVNGKRVEIVTGDRSEQVADPAFAGRG